MSKFGKEQLLKYGWTEGKGLGKDENGIAQAIKPKLKFDTAGIGHKDVDLQWWQNSYNKSLKNIVIEKTNDSVGIKVQSNAKESDSKQNSTNVLQYGKLKFLKMSTLKDGVVHSESKLNDNSENDNVLNSFPNISDEELFKACGGRTAHKGARHGLSLNGKLARIAEQDKNLLNLNSEIKQGDSTVANLKPEARKRKRNKLIELQSTDDESSDNENDVDTLVDNLAAENFHANEYKLSKGSRRKVKRKVEDITHQLKKVCKIDRTKKSELESEEENQVKRNLEIDLYFAEEMVKRLKKIKPNKKKKAIAHATVDVDGDEKMDSNRKFKLHGSHETVEGTMAVKQKKKKLQSETYAAKLNHKISKKKSKKFERKEKKKLLETFELPLDTQLENCLIINPEGAKNRKESKKNKKNKR